MAAAGPRRTTAPKSPAARRARRSNVSASSRAGRADRAAGRGGVAELQRARILTAMGELVREHGIGHVTVAHVVARSGVSRRTFYELFDDRESCLLATFDRALAHATAAVSAAYAAPGTWEEQIRAALAALLGFLDAEPALADLLIVAALAAERRILERRARVLDVLVDAVHRGARATDRSGARARAGRSASASPPARIVAEGAIGAVLAVLHARLIAHRSRSLSALLNPLMGILVLPYRGPAAAARELQSPALRPPKRAHASADPLRGLDMRLTYRTVRVLIAIAEQPLANGRQVADASGISDQGQMSKLLARLQQLGLIHNTAPGLRKGEPNVWSLTPRGQDVERAIRAQASH